MKFCDVVSSLLILEGFCLLSVHQLNLFLQFLNLDEEIVMLDFLM